MFSRQKIVYTNVWMDPDPTIMSKIKRNNTKEGEKRSGKLF